MGAAQILAAMEGVDDIYFDHMSQIRMPSWYDARVALVGDAAAAVSLLAGEGTGLAMVEATVLADELVRSGADHARAFARTCNANSAQRPDRRRHSSPGPRAEYGCVTR